MSNTHILFDFETFGQQTSSCAVINCAILPFDFHRLQNGPYYDFEELIGSTRLLKLDVEHQVKELGYKVEKGALEFWKSLPTEVQKQTKPSKEDLKVPEFCEAFLLILNSHAPISRWWSRGNNFDPIILNRLFNDCGMLHDVENMLKFWLLRDERTYVDAMTGFGLKQNAFNPLSDEEKKIYKQHDAVHDVAMGAMRIQYLESNC